MEGGSVKNVLKQQTLQHHCEDLIDIQNDLTICLKDSTFQLRDIEKMENELLKDLNKHREECIEEINAKFNCVKEDIHRMCAEEKENIDQYQANVYRNVEDVGDLLYQAKSELKTVAEQDIASRNYRQEIYRRLMNVSDVPKLKEPLELALEMNGKLSTIEPVFLRTNQVSSAEYGACGETCIEEYASSGTVSERKEDNDVEKKISGLEDRLQKFEQESDQFMQSVKSEANDVQVTVTEIRAKQFETEKHIEKENLLLQQSLAERKDEYDKLKNAATEMNDALRQANQAINELRNKSEHIHNETVTLKRHIDQMKEEHEEIKNVATRTNDSLLRADQAIGEMRNKSKLIEDETITLKQNMDQMKETLQPIAFSVYMQGLKAVEIGNTIKFDGIATNTGDHYNPVTGHFTCPRSGLYAFFLNLTSERHFNQAYGELIKEGQRLTLVLASNTNKDGHYSHATGSVIVECEVGQRIWVESYSLKSVLLGSKFCTFSGHLISQQ